MEGLFSVVDAYFVGKISNDAVTVVGLTETVATLIYSLAIGISIAATAMVSRRIGEGNKEDAAKAGMQAIIIGASVSVVIGIVGVVFAGDILRLMGAEETVVQSGLNYTRILLGSNIVIMLLFILNGVFRGAGDASMAMVSLWIANILNMILDPLFIFGWGFFPELGVTGAAVATTIGRGIGVLFQLYILFFGSKMIRLSKRHIRIVPDMISRLANVSSTGAAQFLIGSASWIFLARLLTGFGTDVFAGYTFAIRIVIFMILPSWGLANAAATLVGQNLGAQQPERAEISVWRAAFYNMLFLLGLSVCLFLAAKPILNIFTNDAETLRHGVMALRIFCLGNVFYAYGMVVGQAFGGAGDTRTPTFINFICFWMVEIPLAWALSQHTGLGPVGVYWAVVISEGLLAALCVLWFRKGKWKEVKI